MIECIEDYDLSYNLFLAEQEMFRSLAGIEYDIISESTDLVSIQEGVKETVMNYLQKIMTQIQKLWAKFQAVFAEKILTKLEKQFNQAKESVANAEFTVNNYVEYNMQELDKYKIVNFEYNDQTKEDFKSVNTFIEKNYPGLISDDSKDVKKALLAKTTNKVEHFKVDGKILQDMYNYCKNEYKNNVNTISNDITSLNNSSKTITSMVNTVINAQETVQLWESMNLHVYTEADEDSKGDSDKMSFTDNSGETSGESKDDDKKKAQVTTAVTVYMTAETKILSAKMYVVSNKFKTYMRILNHFLGNTIKNNVSNKVSKKKGEKEATPSSAPTVDVK